MRPYSAYLPGVPAFSVGIELPESPVLTHVPVVALDPGRFEVVLTPDGRNGLRQTFERAHRLLEGRVVWTVNSTSTGGGVAEMLRSLIGYARGADLDLRWLVIGGDESFFQITKRLHNRLHGSIGDGGHLGQEELAIYRNRSNANAAELAELTGPDDIVLLHDPQTAGMVPPLVDLGLRVVWRAHIGLDMPNDVAREAWGFLRPFVERAHAFVFSRATYAWEGLDPGRLRVIAPSVDAFSPKNAPLGFTEIVSILGACGLAPRGIGGRSAGFERLDGSPGVVRRQVRLVEEVTAPLDRPVVTQVSRWDRLKDPIGVLQAFARRVAPASAAHLVLAGPDVAAVADDPEGAAVLGETQAAWQQLSDDVRPRVHLALIPMDDVDENAVIVNALQRRSDVLVQKSLAEGFGLTVSEAMWKGRPVVASRVGGIHDQIEDGRTGCLIDASDLDGFADRVNALLARPTRAERMGMAAQVRVRDHFLGPRHIAQWVDLLGWLVQPFPDASRTGAGTS